MNLDDLIIAAFCEIDDAMNACLQELPKARLRERGSMPTVCDSEVLCMEVVGAYLGLEQDQAIYSTSCVTTRTSFRPCHRCIAPPSPAKPPTCRTSKHASGSTGWPIHLTGVTLDSWTRCRCRYVALPAPPFAAAFAMKTLRTLRACAPLTATTMSHVKPFGACACICTSPGPVSSPA